MPYEVEVKYAAFELADILMQLRKLGAVAEPAVEQVDTYFAHPQRDFASTDEALRVRSSGDEHFITYKGPKIDLQTKTRLEIELPLAPGAAVGAQAREMWQKLGFECVRNVSKKRTPYRLDWGNYAVHVMIDEVQGLGTYVDIETIAEEDNCHRAKEAILSLAQMLGLTQSEQRSYLQLLLELDYLMSEHWPTGEASFRTE